MNAIEMGIHSVGTKPIGLDHTLLCRLRRSACAGIDDRNGIAGHVGDVEAAAVCVDGQRHRLGAEVALAGQARIEVALHGELARARC